MQMCKFYANLQKQEIQGGMSSLMTGRVLQVSTNVV